MKSKDFGRILREQGKREFECFKYERGRLIWTKNDNCYLINISYVDLAQYRVEYSFEFYLVSIAVLILEKTGFQATTQDIIRSKDFYSISQQIPDSEIELEIRKSVLWVRDRFEKTKDSWQFDSYEAYRLYLQSKLDLFIIDGISGRSGIAALALLEKIHSSTEYETLKNKIYSSERMKIVMEVDDFFDKVFGFLDNSSADDLYQSLGKLS